MFPSISRPTQRDIVHHTLIEHNNRLIPAIIIKYAATTLRKKIAHDSSATVLMDVVTILPFPTPIAHITVVIFNDPYDPLWAQVCLSLFPIVDGEDSRADCLAIDKAKYDREFVKAFCQPNAECGLLVLDHLNNDLNHQLMPFELIEKERPAEVEEVIHFLNRFDINRNLESVLAPVEVFKKLACFVFKNPLGHPIIIPRGRSLHLAHANIFSMKVEHNRLFDRRAVQAQKVKEKVCFDLFIAHAHLDSEAAQSIAAWLRAIWPRIRVAVTQPYGNTNFQDNPTYFLDDSRRSRCILYLVTPNSIDRPMVDTEVGGNADKPIVSVLLGGISIDDLRIKLSNNPFLAIDIAKAVALTSDDDWPKLAALLARELNLKCGAKLPDPPRLMIIPADQSHDRLIENYLEDNLLIRDSVYQRQTVEQADELLAQIIRWNYRNQPAQIDELLRLSPFQKLITLMLTMDDSYQWINVLEAFPALLDYRLARELVVFEFAALVDAGLDRNKIQKLSSLIAEAIR